MVRQQLDPASLVLVEMIEFYDQPVLFTCEDLDHNLMLAVLNDEDFLTETWIYVDVSPATMHALEAGTIDLYTAFKQPDSGIAWKAILNKTTNTWIALHIDPETLSIHDLPLPGEFLRRQG